MKHTAAVVFLAFGLAAAFYQPCGQYPTTITALDNSTCIPSVYWGPVDGYAPDPPEKLENNCTPTVHNITRTEDDNTGNITVGLCGAGKCHVYDYHTYFEVDLRDLQLAHILKEFPKPPCIALNMSVTRQLNAVAGCEFFCYKRENKDIDDGRPCVVSYTLKFRKNKLLCPQPQRTFQACVTLETGQHSGSTIRNRCPKRKKKNAGSQRHGKAFLQRLKPVSSFIFEN
uniref:Basic tail secreted protein n=1 Tax=Rhipicephalus appendiculatus TaxID=34631 RepID=A0A131YZG1_RHIAP